MKGAHREDLEEKEKNTDQVDEIEAYLTNVPPATCSINEEITGDIAMSTTEPVDTVSEKYCDDDPDDDEEAVDAFAEAYYDDDDGLGDEDDDTDQTGEGSQKNNPIEYQEEGAVTENKDGISESREKPFVKTVQEVAITNIERKNVTDSMPIASVGVENSAPIHTSEASGILVIQEGSAKFAADRVMENKDGKIATIVTENKEGKSATRETVNICSSDMYPIDHGMGESINEKCYVAYGTTEEPSEKLDEISKPSLRKSDTLEQDDSTRVSQHISEISVPEIPVTESEGRCTQRKRKISPRRVCRQIESGSRGKIIGTIEVQDEESKTIESQKDARHAMAHGKVQKRKRKPSEEDPDFIPQVSDQLSSGSIKKQSS